MTRITSLLFLIGTVAVSCSGAIIKGKAPCDHHLSDETTMTKGEQAYINFAEAPALPPMSYVAPAMESMPSASLWPIYPVNVLVGHNKESKAPAVMSEAEYNLELEAPGASIAYMHQVPALPFREIASNSLSEGAIFYQSPLNYAPIKSADGKPCLFPGLHVSAEPLPEAPTVPEYVAPEVVSYNRLEEEVAPVETYQELAPIPEAPMLPPFTVPEIPVQSDFIEEKETTVKEPCEEKHDAILVIPEAPILPGSVAPHPQKLEEIEKWTEPIVESQPATVIPEAPTLPHFVAPVLPIESAYEESIEKEKPSEGHEKHEYLMPIPEAPVLPQFVMPELPLQVYDEPAAAYVPVEPCEHFEQHEETKPFDIPEPPVLPPFVASEKPAHIIEEPTKVETYEEQAPEYQQTIMVIPEAPVLPEYTVPQEPGEHSEYLEHDEPYVIPEAPVLPNFVMPEMPLEEYKEPERVEYNDPCDHKESTLQVIPEAPVLPPFVAPEIPKEEIMIPLMPTIPQLDERYKEEVSAIPAEEYTAPIVIPEAPVLPPFVAPELPTVHEEAIEKHDCEEPAIVQVPEYHLVPSYTPSFIPQAPDCDETKEFKHVEEAKPMYVLPIPANYALSSLSQSREGSVLSESERSIAECIMKIFGSRAMPAAFAAPVITPAGTKQRAPVVPMSSPFFYPAMTNGLPIY